MTRWMRKILLSAGLIIGVALIIAVIVWGRITHWGQSSVGSAELRARVGIVPFVVFQPGSTAIHRNSLGRALHVP